VLKVIVLKNFTTTVPMPFEAEIRSEGGIGKGRV
jgi:hypothetical protein